MDIMCETKTRDNVFVNIVACILYRVADESAKEVFYQLSRPQAQIQAYVFDVIRSSVPRMNLDEVFEQKKLIAKSVENELQKAMTTYSYEVVQTLILDVIPHETVRRAMNEINAVVRLREAARERAEPEKILQVKPAEAEAESKSLNGEGIARQRQAIVDGLRESIIGFSNNVPRSSLKDVLDMVLLTQYFDTERDRGTIQDF